MEIILKFAAKHKDRLKIAQQYPTQLGECRHQVGEMAEEVRRRDKNVKTRLVIDTLYVNGGK